MAEITEAQKKHYERLLKKAEDDKWWADLENKSCLGGGIGLGTLTGLTSFVFGGGIPGGAAGFATGCTLAVGGVRIAHKLNGTVDDGIEYGNKQMGIQSNRLLPHIPLVTTKFERF